MSDKVKNHQFLVRIVGGTLAPLLILLTDYRENYILLILLVIMYLSLNILVRFALLDEALSNRIYRGMLFFDVIMISLAIGTRGGMRSDFYLGYFLIMGYVMVVPEKSLLLKLSGWIVLCYGGVTYLTSDPAIFSLGRLFIRLTILIGTAFLLRLFVDEMIEYKEKHTNAMNLAFRDSMTDAYNRRMLTYLIEETDSTLHSHVAMLDLDDFKVINDTYGHSYGDQVLIALVSCIKRHTSSRDICIRYGGEEFLIIFNNTTTPESLQILNNIHNDYSNLNYQWFTSKEQITFTAGLTTSTKQLSLMEEIIQADSALYKGKSSGKNCTILYDQRITPIKIKAHLPS